MPYDAQSADQLAAHLHVPRVVLFDEVGSTLDVAHTLGAEGAVAGTLVLANAQTAGRGRHGRSWRSEPGAGVWLTLVERPPDEAAIDVLSVRIGIAMAPALDELAGETVRLKWPNDLHLSTGKLAGVLVEARWREGSVDWIAVGVGINLRAFTLDPRPSTLDPQAAGLRPGVTRLEVLERVVPVIRHAVQRRGSLSPDELATFAERDLAAGRVCLEPVRGRVCGIDPTGALVVDVGLGVVAMRTGSLILQEVP